ncbi:hypothetical protein BVC80_9079g9 [Macleaya cordata]|uniref:Uncharacterized protein n=1 Tax=Macleaya cordata TaxID=56857 RepID=A0A200PUL2_MACCD|nr:hypothetical protein BVC80_9079g9 [Macleaya cordata]
MASMILTLPEFAISSVATRGEIPSKLFSRTNPRKRINFRSFDDNNNKEKVEESRGIRCSSTKYCEVRVSDFGQNAKISRQFSAPVKESSSSKQNKDDEEKQNYYVNTGYAIRALREEFPQIFFRELNFDIYSLV